MRARAIDPRDGTSEDDAPSYRVFFWDEDGVCDEWQLDEADLDEVLAWIPARAEGRSHSLWAVSGGPGSVHLVRLRGVDPPAPEGTWPGWAREVR